MTTQVDVLIAGAGPTGLTLACDLLRRGLSVQLVDANTEAASNSRAVAMHARTLEMLEPLGVTKELLPLGKTLHGVTVFAEGEPIARADFEELDSTYKLVLSVPQTDTEACLTRALEALGGKVDRGVKLAGFRQDGTGVTCELVRGENKETVRAAWLVGCDGAQSVVRKKLELAFEEGTHDDDFVLADLKITWDVRDDRVSAFLGEDGVFACFPMPGGTYRIIASLPMEARESKAAPTLSDMQTLFAQRTGKNGTLSDPTWIARFKATSRQVKHYRDDRVFLAGEAAHVHSPAGGQGLNAGIQDALNLGWKLALVHQGHARGLLLGTYQLERHGAGRAVIRSSDVAAKMANVKGNVAKSARNELARFLSAFEIVQARAAKDISDLGINYEQSPIVREDKTGLLNARLGSAAGGDTPTLGSVREFAVAPAAGQRAPDGKITLAGQGGTQRLLSLLDGKKHALLLFDGRSHSAEGYARFTSLAASVNSQFGDAIGVWVVTPRSARPAEVPNDVPVLLDPDADLEKRYAATTECVYLVRPDGYIGYRSQPCDEGKLMEYLKSVFRSA